MRLLWRNLSLALAFIALAWIVDAAVDTALFHEGTFLGILFGDVPPVELYKRILGAVTILAFATVLTLLSARRNAALEALQESEQRYRRLFDGSRDALMTLSPPSWKFDSCNPAAIAMFGVRDEADFISRAPWQYSPERQPDGRDSGEKAREMIDTAMRGSSHLFEWTHRRADGADFPATVLLTRTEIAGETILQATVRDITEGKRVEAALEESEERFRDLVESTSDWVWEVDAQGRYTYCADSITGVLGYTPEELLGKARFDLMRADEVARVGEIFAGIVAEKARFVDLENWNLSKDGREVCLLTNGMPRFDESGELIGYRGADRDITERKRVQEALEESETRYGAVFDQANDLILVLELVPNGSPIIREANRTALQAFGYTRDELVGKPTSFVEAGPSSEALIQERQRIARETDGSFEVLHRRKDGSVFLVEAAVKEVKMGGKILAISIERDITERKRLETELLSSRDRLRKLTAHLGEVREEERRLLARELHDEVGQSLTAMRWDLGSIERGPPDGLDPFAERLDSMIDIVDHAVARVNRISHELRSPVLELLGLEEAIQAHAEEIQERTGLGMGLDLKLGELESSPERDNSILRIFQEAMSNVTRHAQARRAEVSLRLEGGSIVLEVRDDGIGIAEEKLRDEGSFGLTGMRERAVLFGGKVEIGRNPASGTRVTAVLPAGSA